MFTPISLLWLEPVICSFHAPFHSEIFTVKCFAKSVSAILKRSKFNSVLSSHWLLTPSHSYESLEHTWHTYDFTPDLATHVRFCDWRMISWFHPSHSYESLGRVSLPQQKTENVNNRNVATSASSFWGPDKGLFQSQSGTFLARRAHECVAKTSGTYVFLT